MSSAARIRGHVRETGDGGAVVAVDWWPMDHDLASVSESDRAWSEAPAKAVCAVCPVRERCLSQALEVGEPMGIFGGLNETERRGLLRLAPRRRNGRRPRPVQQPGLPMHVVVVLDGATGLADVDRRSLASQHLHTV